jgi:sulfite exporter TauE/SafE
MTAAAEITGPLAALVAGIITSLHCIGMCGPISCAVCVKKTGEGTMAAAFFYHAARLVSYAIAGLAAGALGRHVAAFLSTGTLKGITWVFIVLFLLVALGLDKRFPIPPLGRWTSAAAQSALRLGPLTRPAALGLLTPFIPCMPLYVVVAAAALSGSALTGGAIMGAFALGTVPLLLGLQSQYIRLGSRLTPQKMEFLRRSLAGICVAMLAFRAFSETGCPLCP